MTTKELVNLVKASRNTRKEAESADFRKRVMAWISSHGAFAGNTMAQGKVQNADKGNNPAGEQGV